MAADASPAPESAAQDKARLRRERRAAKIQQGGASRLAAITSVQGGSHRDVEQDVPGKPKQTPSPSTRPASIPAATATPDPDEVDISQHHYTPASQPRHPSPFAFEGAPAGAAPVADQALANDPMMQMMAQIMGGQLPGGMPAAAGQQGAGAPPGGLPPGLANLLSGMQAGQAQEPSPEHSSAWIWRLVHSVFALALAVYMVLRTPFTGSKLARAALEEGNWAGSAPAEPFAHFFYLFATFEVVLQTSRFYIEKGQLQGSGLLSTVSQFLPEPYAGYVRMVGRYSVIYTTVVSDAMVLVFVLGVVSFWRGGAAA